MFTEGFPNIPIVDEGKQPVKRANIKPEVSMTYNCCDVVRVVTCPFFLEGPGTLFFQ